MVRKRAKPKGNLLLPVEEEGRGVVVVVVVVAERNEAGLAGVAKAVASNHWQKQLLTRRKFNSSLGKNLKLLEKAENEYENRVPSPVTGSSLPLIHLP